MRMPFGKYKGSRLEDVPLEYISWLIDQDFLRDPLRSAVEEEYDRRTNPEDDDEDPGPIPIPVNLNLVEELLNVGFRVLSKKYHPDLGGSHQAMTELNHCIEWLRAGLTKLRGGAASIALVLFVFGFSLWFAIVCLPFVLNHLVR
jgi:Putative quorum-sensing-regulated virulence factor